MRAVDAMIAGDWQAAKTELAPSEDELAAHLYLLASELESAELQRRRAEAFVRHEIGNALAVALANTEGIIDGVLPSDPQRWQGIAEALETAAALVERWRRSPDGRRQAAPSDTKTFNICALIGAQYAAIAGLAQAKDVRVAYYPCGKGHAQCVEFRGDPVAIGQILRNVLVNAVRYTPRGGNVEINCDRPDGQVRVAIRDSGPGVAPEDAERIFEEGYRGGNAAEGGSGLGLNVVANLLEAFGGQARVVEEGRGGATFAIDLPASPAN